MKGVGPFGSVKPSIVEAPVANRLTGESLLTISALKAGDSVAV